MSKFVFGTAGVIQWIHAGSTVTLTPNYTELEWNQAAEESDTTSGNLTWDTHLPTRRNWEASLKMFFDDGSTNGTAHFSHLTAWETGLLALGPQGTATGAMKFGGSCSVVGADMSMAHAEPLTVDLSFKGNGTPYWNFGSAWA
jgi:hypothetical protein